MNTKKDIASLIMLGLLSIGISFLLYQCKKTTVVNNNSGGSSGPGTNEVWIQNMAFNPSTITVAKNTTVSWSNKDGVAHTVTSTSGAFDSGSIGSGGSYTHQFTGTGTFPYKCSFHSSMSGTVIVQ